MTRPLAALAVVLALLVAPAQALARNADPALWVMRDADTTIYLFGTVHFLPRDLTWFDGEVAKAFTASDELRMEILPVDDPASLGPLILKLAVDPQGRTLAQKLSAEDHAAYAAAMKAIGLSPEPLEPLEPWFVAVQAATVMYVKSGLDPKTGAEEVLTEAARKSGKAITAFETPEQQFAMLDSTPESEQLQGVRDFAYHRDESVALMSEMVEHWARGEADVTGRLMNEDMKETPETARILLRDRNARWAADLKQRMNRPGVVFVAVGAGHLAGQDNLRDFLAKEGLRVERVPE